MSMTEDQLAYQQRSARLYQSRYDDVLRQVGMRAPQPILGQHPDDYRRETLRTLKRTFLNNHDLYKINMRGLPSDVLPQFEGMVLEAGKIEILNPKNVPLGEIKQINVLDEGGKLMRRDFVGQECFVKFMPNYREGRRVVRFNQAACNCAFFSILSRFLTAAACASACRCVCCLCSGRLQPLVLQVARSAGASRSADRCLVCRKPFEMPPMCWLRAALTAAFRVTGPNSPS